MNPLQKLRNLIADKPGDSVLNFKILMTNAAHHSGANLSKYDLNCHVLCGANLAVLRDFELGIFRAISALYREAADAGLDVVFPIAALPPAPLTR